MLIIDDYSTDNSIKIISELMKEDQRIIYLQNKDNKGALYTKTRGILNAKGKYVMTLDEDYMLQMMPFQFYIMRQKKMI